MEKYNIIIPALAGDAKKVLNNLEFFEKYLTFDKIIFIGNAEVKAMVDSLKNKRLSFINEESIVEGMNFKSIKQLISARNGNPKRTGWYYQQFIKIAYAKICKDNYYLCWDSDTVPTKKVSMFKSDKPIFDIKTEYYKPYFDTIHKLFGIDKKIDGSFISEHMLFNVKVVKKMLDDIENNLSLSGNNFYEKIINSVDEKELSLSGFSEFETYGTYVTEFYPKMYVKRTWRSLREGMFYLNLPLKEVELKWISKNYDAVSFERHDPTTILRKLWNNNFCYKHISVNFITTINYPYMMIRKAFIMIGILINK